MGWVQRVVRAVRRDSASSERSGRTPVLDLRFATLTVEHYLAQLYCEHEGTVCLRGAQLRIAHHGQRRVFPLADLPASGQSLAEQIDCLLMQIWDWLEYVHAAPASDSGGWAMLEAVADA